MREIDEAMLLRCSSMRLVLMAMGMESLTEERRDFAALRLSEERFRVVLEGVCRGAVGLHLLGLDDFALEERARPRGVSGG